MTENVTQTPEQTTIEQVEAPKEEIKSILNVNKDIVEEVADKDIEVVKEITGLIDINLLENDFRELATVKKFIVEDKLDINKVIKSLVNAESLIGKRIQELDANTLKEITSKLGVPESADKYDLKEIAGLEDLNKIIREVSFANNIPNEAAAKMFEVLAETEAAKLNAKLEAEKKSILANQEILQKEFSTAYNERIKAADKALDLFGTKELRKYLEESGGANNADMIKFLATVGTKFINKTSLNSDVEKVLGTTPAEAKDKIAALRADPNFNKKYFDSTVAGHKEAVDEITRLYKLAYGNIKQ